MTRQSFVLDDLLPDVS